MSTPSVLRSERPLGGARSRFANAWRLDGSATITAILVCVFGFMVLYPIGTVVNMSFKPGGLDAVWSLAAWGRAWAEPGLVTSIVNTLEVVLATQAISLPIAMMIAWVLARTDVPFRRCARVRLLDPVLPAGARRHHRLAAVLRPQLRARQQVADGLGPRQRSAFNMYSYWGIVFAHLTTYGLSVKVMLLTPAFRNMDGSIEEASRMCGASRRSTLMAHRHAADDAGDLRRASDDVIRGLEAFEIELFLGMPINFWVYSTKIYRSCRRTRRDTQRRRARRRPSWS